MFDQWSVFRNFSFLVIFLKIGENLESASRNMREKYILAQFLTSGQFQKLQFLGISRELVKAKGQCLRFLGSLGSVGIFGGGTGSENKKVQVY